MKDFSPLHLWPVPWLLYSRAYSLASQLQNLHRLCGQLGSVGRWGHWDSNPGPCCFVSINPVWTTTLPDGRVVDHTVFVLTGEFDATLLIAISDIIQYSSHAYVWHVRWQVCCYSCPYSVWFVNSMRHSWFISAISYKITPLPDTSGRVTSVLLPLPMQPHNCRHKHRFENFNEVGADLAALPSCFLCPHYTPLTSPKRGLTGTADKFLQSPEACSLPGWTALQWHRRPGLSGCCLSAFTIGLFRNGIITNSLHTSSSCCFHPHAASLLFTTRGPEPCQTFPINCCTHQQFRSRAAADQWSASAHCWIGGAVNVADVCCAPLHTQLFKCF